MDYIQTMLMYTFYLFPVSAEKNRQQIPYQQQPMGSSSTSSSGGNSLLPVLVFVHGEDYGYGAGHPYDPSMLASQGQVIVVTMNYRLGILGK